MEEQEARQKLKASIDEAFRMPYEERVTYSICLVCYQLFQGLQHCAPASEVLPSLPKLEGVPVYFFGCWARAGHYLWDKEARHVRDLQVPEEFWSGKLDGGAFAATPQKDYRSPQPLGVVRLQLIIPAKGGPAWSVISMWDRSLDNRGNCNASFLAPGVFTTEEMWALAERDYPAIVKRIRNYKEK